MRCAVTVVAGMVAWLWTGCATVPVSDTSVELHGVAKVTADTGRVLTRADVQHETAVRFFGNDTYAEVNSRWLTGFYADFRAELFRLGVVRWNERFDCGRFAELYTSLAQAKFYLESFHSRTTAKALAIGPYWYVRGDGKGTHAVVQALTERGRMFIDPQTGAEIQLTPRESATAYYQFF